MANETNTTTEILKFQIEQGDAIAQQEKLKSLLISLKAEASDLQKAYKAGSISLQEFADGSVRVENTQKLLVNQYSQVQRSVTGLKNPIKELTEQNKKLTDQFSQLGEKLEVGGTSLTGLIGKMTAFATPAGAALALVGGLVEAYKDSAVGAEDLARAQSTLTATFEVLSNEIGNESGGGFAEKAASFFSNIIIDLKAATNNSKALGDQEKALDKDRVAAADHFIEKLREIQVERVKAQTQAAIEETQARSLREIRDDSSKSLQERLEAANTIQDKFNKSLEINAEITREQILALLREGEATGIVVNGTSRLFQQTHELNDANIKSRALKIEILTLQKEIVEEESAAQRQIVRANLAQSKLVEEVQKEQDLRSKEQSNLKYKPAPDQTFGGPLEGVSNPDEASQLASESSTKSILDQEAEDLRDHNLVVKEIFGEKADLYIQDASQYTHNVKTKQQLDEEAAKLDRKMLNAKVAIAEAAGKFFEDAFGDNQATQVANAIVNTYAGAAMAIGTYPAPYGEILAALVIADGLVDVAKIAGVKYASGGYTGPGGKYQPAGIVHAGEVVWSQQDVAMAGGPSRANSMRPTSGYSDGGIVASMDTAKFDQQIMMNDIFKQIPAPVLGYKEFVEFQTRVKYKEQLTQA